MAAQSYAFRDSEFMTKHDKQRVLAHWVKFLKSGCKLVHFTNDLYKHLINHCSFIAHFNKHGFYDVYFADASYPQFVQFCYQFDPRGEMLSAECRMSYWRTGEYSDINHAMCEQALPYLDKLKAEYKQRYAGNLNDRISALTAIRDTL